MSENFAFCSGGRKCIIRRGLGAPGALEALQEDGGLSPYLLGEPPRRPGPPRCPEVCTSGLLNKIKQFPARARASRRSFRSMIVVASPGHLQDAAPSSASEPGKGIEKWDLIRPGWLIEQLLAKSRPVRHRIKGKKSDPDNHLRVVTAEDLYVGNTKGTDQRKTCPLSGGSIPGNLDLLQIKVPPQSTIDCRGTTIEIPRDGLTG